MVFYSRSGGYFCASVAVLSGVCGILFLGLAGTAQAVPNRDCADVPYQTAMAAGAGAAGGGAIAGPPGAAIGAGTGAILGMIGGCKQEIEGTPVLEKPDATVGAHGASSASETKDLRWCQIWPGASC